MVTELQLARRMRELITAGWTQGNDARGADGVPVHTLRKEATCFCLAGAFVRAHGETLDLVSDDNSKCYRAQATLAYAPSVEVAEKVWKRIDQLVGRDPVSWNDAPERKAEEVTALLDRVIEKIEKEQT